MLNHTIPPSPVGEGRCHRQDVPAIDPTRPRCHSCALATKCLPGRLDPGEIQKFERAVSRSRPLRAGEHLFRMGDSFRSIFVVNSGSFKTCTVDTQGREHISAFHFAGDLIGIDAIYPDRHVSSAIALSSGTVCILPYTVLTCLAHEIPEIQGQILRMLSREMLGNSSMAGDFTAEERLAAFLVMVSARQRHRARESADLDLAMTRQDIANYLRLAPETVSRVLARFQKSGLIRADRRHIALLDTEGIEDLAACMNPYGRCG
jgi:CRP/FNR family transcriptional regulator